MLKEKRLLLTFGKIFPLFLFLIIFISACGGENKREKEEAVATVNKSTILVKEFQKELAMNARRDTAFKVNYRVVEEQLEMMIDKKLMIQEAMNLGLAGNERFIESIKAFWEQALIRDLIEAKTKEWDNRLFVTEEEIQAQYKRLQYRLTLRLVGDINKEDAEDTKNKMINGEKVKDEETIGPLSYETAGMNLEEDVINTAFDMAQNEVRIFEHGDGDVTILQIINREKVLLPALNEVHGRVKELILEYKKHEAIEDWLKGIKHAAAISINKQALKRISHEQ